MKDNTMLVSIIIPFLDKWELIHQRMNDLRVHAPDNCEIVLVDDCSVGNYDNEVGWWQNYGAIHSVTYVKNEKNLGFGGAMNKGAEYAKGDILVFLSNDVVIYNDFITPIVVADQYHKHSCLMGVELLDYDTGWNKIGNTIIPYLNGYLLACHKTIWDDVGGFDERFFPFDYEDVDLSMMAVKKGYKLLQLSGIKIKHMGAGTIGYNPEREKKTLENREKWIKKWEKENLEQMK